MYSGGVLLLTDIVTNVCSHLNLSDFTRYVLVDYDMF